MVNTEELKKIGNEGPGEKKLKGIEELKEEYEKLEKERPKLGEKQNGYIDATQEMNPDENSFDEKICVDKLKPLIQDN